MSISQQTRDKIAKPLVGKTGETARAWKGGKPNCIDCGKIMVWYNAKRCKPCAGLNRRGEKAYNYKGNTTLDYRERRRFRHEMQKQVFIRDNYTCQVCLKRGGDLQVDHIKSWAKFIELRFEINNCRTLCAKCHYKITFGKDMPVAVKGWGHNLLRGIAS